MKRIVLVLLAVLMTSVSFAQFNQARRVMDNNKPIVNLLNKNLAAEVEWAQISTPFVANDVYGNQVSLQSYLDAGKCVVIDYSCTWCGPCWNMHNSGLLEEIDALEDVQVIWVEIESSNTTAQIFGPQGGSSYSDMTYGNWTVTSTGDSIEYPIIDDDANQSCLATCYGLYQGYVPTIFFITPDGYYCDLNIANSIINYQDISGSIANINELVATYPRSGQAPVASIAGKERVRIGSEATFTANILSIDPVTSVEWTLQGATPATATGNTATCSWDAAGTYTLTVTVTNANGTATATKTIEAYVPDPNLLSYVDHSTEVETFLGTGSQVYWANAFPASMLPANKYINYVDIFVGSSYSGNYELIIYQGGSMSAPGQEIYRKTRNLTGTNNYVNFLVDGAVALDNTQPLWLVFHTTNISYPMACLPYSGDEGSDLLSLDGAAWEHAATYGYNNSWGIDCHLADTPNEGITETLSTRLNMYPNPTTGILTIAADGVQEVNVMDVDGRVIMTSNSNVVDMTNLNNGVYFVRVITANGATTQKVVKK